jgi:hypothetical protein
MHLLLGFAVLDVLWWVVAIVANGGLGPAPSSPSTSEE